MAIMPTLYTFGASHFCEKARWSLDLCGLSYREVRWAPGPHQLAARRIAAGTSLPILVCAGGTIQGSGAIMDWLEASGPTPWRHQPSPDQRREIARLTTAADQTGVAVRRLIYATGLSSEPGGIARQLLAGTAWHQRALGWAMWPLTRRVIMTSLNATADDIPMARAAVEQELEQLDATLADGRRFLVGDRLSRADVATASLLSPIVRPPRHPVYPDLTPWAAYQHIIDRYRDRRCVAWAAQIYDDFRQPPAPLAAARPWEEHRGERNQTSISCG